jgi:hypothetical protein
MAETFQESFSDEAEEIAVIGVGAGTGTRPETGAVVGGVGVTIAREDWPEAENTAAESSELEDVPGEESPGAPGDALSPEVVAGLF